MTKNYWEVPPKYIINILFVTWKINLNRAAQKDNIHANYAGHPTKQTVKLTDLGLSIGNIVVIVGKASYIGEIRRMSCLVSIQQAIKNLLRNPNHISYITKWIYG